MVYEAFLNQVKEQTAKLLGDDYCLSLQKIPKNNGTVMDGLCISRGKTDIAPAIYLNSCYEQYKNGRPISAISAEIVAQYRATPVPAQFDCRELLNFKRAAPRLACRLIHRQSNLTLLKRTPHIPWNDLALVFYLYMEEHESGIMTASVHKLMFDLWDVPIKELAKLALENTRNFFPPVISSIDYVLEELGEAFPGLLPPTHSSFRSPSPFYVLSNSRGINGAVCMLYPDVLKNFAEGTESDLLILPSSIHEVLLLPNPGAYSYKSLSDIVSYINHSEVPMAERLSNQIYLFSRKDEKIHVVSHNFQPVTTFPESDFLSEIQ